MADDGQVPGPALEADDERMPEPALEAVDEQMPEPALEAVDEQVPGPAQEAGPDEGDGSDDESSSGDSEDGTAAFLHYWAQMAKERRQGYPDPDRTNWRMGRGPRQWNEPGARPACGDGVAGNTRSKAPLPDRSRAPPSSSDSEESDDSAKR